MTTATQATAARTPIGAGLSCCLGAAMVRPTTGQRGYGLAHKAERKRWEPKVKTGLVPCARCGEPLEPGRPWDLGHNEDRTGWSGPEHTVCNRRAGGTNGALVTNAAKGKPVRSSREW